MPQPDHDMVVAEARKWLGTRWHHQGRNEAGIDCAGLVIKVCEALGIPYADQEGYRRSPDGSHFLNLVRGQTTAAPEPRPGMVAIFREQTYPCHVAIFGERDGKLSIIHAYASAHKVVEDYFTDEWRSRLIETRGLIGVTDTITDEDS